MSAGISVHEAAKKLHEESILYCRERPVGTVAARDPEVDALNYDHCFTRDFVVSAMAFLMVGDTEIVRNFLIETVALQNRKRRMDCFQPGQGLMPASFKINKVDGEEHLVADFGDQAIARVAPVDAGFWWLFILRAYVKKTGDLAMAHQPDFQQAIRLILDLCLTARFEMYPTLLVPDGCFMIDRRLGVYGHPLDIQALFYVALRSAEELLVHDDRDGESYLGAVSSRLGHLAFHVREYYWLDIAKLNEIYRYDVEEFGIDAKNKFNIYPGSIPGWLTEWMPEHGGYFAGNLGPGRMDFRFFAQGNLMSVITSMATAEQAAAIVELVEKRWHDLVGRMPLKICYPALEGEEWRIMTGADQKNTPWSYHNGGSWPFLTFLLAAASIKTGKIELGKRALDVLEKRLPLDNWPEYYDGRNGRLVGRQARMLQTWTIAGYLAARELLEHPENLALIDFADQPLMMACPI